MHAAFAGLTASVIFTSISITQGNPFSTIALISSVLITAVPGTFITVKLFLMARVSATWTRGRLEILEKMLEEVELSYSNLTNKVWSLSGEVSKTTFNESYENMWHELRHSTADLRPWAQLTQYNMGGEAGFGLLFFKSTRAFNNKLSSFQDDI
ncbi:hypothetical protein BDK51DRAFT_42534 [Blyttiomyces helicus]|uniref:Uncharacterized protein n=1 Tax=Blyttiomyces helicus TaxID=388810 RepID=A0A4P9WB16_9FUNG|nr:hypothetical protein BDK51DRAFT_42534 [Blyttiomyces helicus]|eukprot:RKO88090.1 hypothetical protein BDK51DRAFT_42534 [Blyttiomyces helicus]